MEMPQAHLTFNLFLSRHIVRGIMIKGAGLATLWQETLILIGMTMFLLAVGSRKLAIRLG